jgi:hypothetical protein
VIGSRVAATVAMTGLTCLLVAVWLTPPRDDHWRRPPGDDGPDPRDDGPPDWDRFDRLRREWEVERSLNAS